MFDAHSRVVLVWCLSCRYALMDKGVWYQCPGDDVYALQDVGDAALRTLAQRLHDMTLLKALKLVRESCQKLCFVAEMNDACLSRMGILSRRRMQQRWRML